MQCGVVFGSHYGEQQGREYKYIIIAKQNDIGCGDTKVKRFSLRIQRVFEMHQQFGNVLRDCALVESS